MGFDMDNNIDYTKLSDAMQNLSETLLNAAKNEIDLGAKIRECEKLHIELSILKKGE